MSVLLCLEFSAGQWPMFWNSLSDDLRDTDNI